MKLRLNGSRTFFYPDVMAACGPDNPDDDFETEPCLLVEVLSPSTAAHDRVGKYGAYTALPSLQTYLLVEQAQRHVYAYERRGAEWLLSDLQGHGQIELTCLGRPLSLGEIYAGLLSGE